MLLDELLLACRLLYYHGEQLRVRKSEWQSPRLEFRLYDVEVAVLTPCNFLNAIQLGTFDDEEPFHA
jgi:hypothetical protein